MAPRNVNSSAKPAYIEHARVLDVHLDSWTLTVATEFTKKPLSNVSWSSVYLHSANGEGIHVMPEVGATCWVCFPSDGHKPFVLAFSPPPNEGNFRALRKDMNPGDIFLGTRDENFLILRRGGVVQVGAGPLSQRMYIPLENIIRDFCENYEMQTLAGSMEWSVGREEETIDGKRPSRFRVLAREYASDAQPIASLEIGSHEDDEKSILSLTIKDSGAEGAATKISLSFDKDGSARWDFKKDVTWRVSGDFSLKAKNISQSAEEEVRLTAKSGFFVKGKTVLIEAQSTADMKAGSVITLDAPTIIAGGKGSPVAKAAPLLLWLGTHNHPAIGAPPAVPPPSSISSTTLWTS